MGLRPNRVQRSVHLPAPLVSMGGDVVPGPSALATSNHPGRRAIAVVIAAVVVVAGVAGGYLLLNHEKGGTSGVVDDGPTFYQALASLNASVAGVPGGPWALSQVIGIATPVPSSPSVFGWPGGGYPTTMASCQAAFNGLTLWNGTIPLFNGTFNSGTAPFWQFVYFSNASEQLLVGTDVNGVVRVFPPIAMSSPCAVASDLAYESWDGPLYRFGLHGNTPAMASSAWNAGAKGFVESLGTEPTEMYFLSSLDFGSGQPGDMGTDFFLCGTAGAAGVTRGLDVFADPMNTAIVSETDTYMLGCTPTYDNWTAIPVELRFSNLSTVTWTGASGIRQTWTVYTDGVSPSDRGVDSLGITSWMINLELNDSQGQPLALATSGCSSWVASLTDCAANAAGWYAVLLGGEGTWMGSFGETAHGPGWSSPVIPVVTNETLAIVVPSSWNIAGDSLVASSTTPELPLSGSSPLS
jgi:hypothetical protein